MLDRQDALQPRTCKDHPRWGITLSILESNHEKHLSSFKHHSHWGSHLHFDVILNIGVCLRVNMCLGGMGGLEIPVSVIKRDRG